ncbi:hypothetical protein DPEC_G00361530 [Dallia pectoralis]|nr:hypothetical protein DPEC_G00361530 [Dallia pectoralis]
MVFNMLVRHRFTDADALYKGVSDVDRRQNEQLKPVPRQDLTEIHEARPRTGNHAPDQHAAWIRQYLPETNAVYKLCTAACLPDACPRVVYIQGHFAWVLGSRGKTPKNEELQAVHAQTRHQPQRSSHQRGQSSVIKKVGSAYVTFEAAHDILAIYAPDAHSWVLSKLVSQWSRRTKDTPGDYLGQCSSESDDKQTPTPKIDIHLGF